MKKLLTALLTLLMIFTLVGCNSKKDEPTVVEQPEQQEVVESANEEPEIIGGFVDVEDGTLTDELKDLFNKALEGLLGAKYEPVKLLATQVVNGTNYKFLANGTKTTNPITIGTYNITINESSDGTVSLVDIETIEESQEEKVDPTQYSYWVVFYDQYGNELQRTVEKYGTTPTFKGELPAGFEKWVYKKTKKDVGKFLAITTNTYFEAVCHDVGAGGLPPVSYLTWNGSELVEAITCNYKELTDETTTLEGGFYIVKGSDVQTDYLTVNGTSSNPTYIILCNGSKLTTTSSVNNEAGIVVEDDKKLIITTPANGDGALEVQGGEHSAGIGSNNESDNCCGDITINGGAITSTGGQYGAGIGCGAGGNEGAISINGGNVTATGGQGGAGIGSGTRPENDGGNGVTINIRGGEVIATGGDYLQSVVSGGAGIGGGEYANSGNITISGGTVTATGKKEAAGIGSGNLGKGGNTVISGGTVTATGGEEGAGIGGGSEGYAGDITISGGTVTATGGLDGGAGIGGGHFRGAGTITINDGTITAKGNGGAGIGGGYEYNYITDGSGNKVYGGFEIIINGGTINATGIKGAGIGGGGSCLSKETNTCAKDICINGGTINAEAVKSGDTGGAAIGSSGKLEAVSLAFDATKTFTIYAGEGRQLISVEYYLDDHYNFCMKVEIITN